MKDIQPFLIGMTVFDSVFEPVQIIELAAAYMKPDLTEAHRLVQDLTSQIRGMRRELYAALAHAVVTDERLWDGALAEIDGLEEAVTADLDRIDEVGMYEAMKECAE